MDYQVLGPEGGRGVELAPFRRIPESPPLIGQVEPEPRPREERGEKEQGECCLGRGKICVHTSTIPGMGLTMTD